MSTITTARPNLTETLKKTEPRPSVLNPESSEALSTLMPKLPSHRQGASILQVAFNQTENQQEGQAAPIFKGGSPAVGPGPKIEGKLSFELFNPGAMTERDKHLAIEHYKEAVREINRVNPALGKTLEREDIRVVFTDDAKAKWKEVAGRDVEFQRKLEEWKRANPVAAAKSDPLAEYLSATQYDGFTATEFDDKKVAKGTTIYIDKIAFMYRPGVAGSFVALTATLDHELHHCNQPTHPEKGKASGAMSVAAEELDAFTRSRQDMWLMKNPEKALESGVFKRNAADGAPNPEDVARVKALKLDPLDSHDARAAGTSGSRQPYDGSNNTAFNELFGRGSRAGAVTLKIAEFQKLVDEEKKAAAGQKK